LQKFFIHQLVKNILDIGLSFSKVIRMKTLVVPAIIAKSQNELDEMLRKVIGKVERVQLDVMDGEFVPNTSLNFEFSISKYKNLEFEAHLMVANPLEWIQMNSDKVNLITMHIESLKQVDRAIEILKKKGVKVGLALNPKTKVVSIKPYLEKIDSVLIMTVDPGSYCVKKEFRLKPLGKIRMIRKMDEVIPIEVDGCMNPKNAKLAREAGANVFVSGSFIFKGENLDKAIAELNATITS
jgi:ribulose-phosphate 3-epimerase